MSEGSTTTLIWHSLAASMGPPCGAFEAQYEHQRTLQRSGRTTVMLSLTRFRHSFRRSMLCELEGGWHAGSTLVELLHVSRSARLKLGLAAPIIKKSMDG